MSGTGQQRWLAVIGLGEDGIEGLSPAARALIANAKVVIGGKRHLALADGLPRAERKSWASPITDSIPEILKYRGEPVAVLASGDPYCYGIGSLLSPHIPSSEIIAIPPPSSLSLACSRLGWARTIHSWTAFSANRDSSAFVAAEPPPSRSLHRRDHTRFRRPLSQRARLWVLHSARARSLGWRA